MPTVQGAHSRGSVQVGDFPVMEHGLQSAATPTTVMTSCCHGSAVGSTDGNGTATHRSPGSHWVGSFGFAVLRRMFPAPSTSSRGSH